MNKLRDRLYFHFWNTIFLNYHRQLLVEQWNERNTKNDIYNTILDIHMKLF